jgi:alkanesulfonate monooxygenase SsuD/methylene tetrahydromethanopterin reductase-like flavin-dependent oxidoreductase (luciferase family)
VTGQLHINVNILNAGVFGGSWRFPGTDGLASYTIEHYTSIAKKAEEAKLDAVFLANGPVLDPQIKHRAVAGSARSPSASPGTPGRDRWFPGMLLSPENLSVPG